MNRTRPSIIITHTGHPQVDALLSEADQHMQRADDEYTTGQLAQDSERYADAKVRFLRCLIEQNAANLCVATAQTLMAAEEGKARRWTVTTTQVPRVGYMREAAGK